jgi:hypothetical protein
MTKCTILLNGTYNFCTTIGNGATYEETIEQVREILQEESGWRALLDWLERLCRAHESSGCRA